MTTVILVRHGESMANKEGKFAGCGVDTPLQPRGLHQAELTAQYVAENYALANVYSSNLQRAYITGKTIGDKFGLDVIVREDLREIYGGKWEGLPFEDMGRLYPEEFHLWNTDRGHACCPQGESIHHMAQRVYDAVTRIAEENPGKTVLATTHATPVLVMQALVQNGNLDNLNSVPLASNASLTVFQYENGTWRCTATSIDAHLGSLKTELPKNV